MQNHSIEPLAYGSEEAWLALGIGRSTFFKLLKSGEIRSIRIGKKLLVTKAEIERVIATAEQNASGAKAA